MQSQAKAAASVHLFEMSISSQPSESCYQCLHIFGNRLSLHCKDVAWMITPQPEMSAS